MTGIEDIQIGYILKADTSIGTYFEAPPIETEKTIESVRTARLELLNEFFSKASQDAFIISSLGFMANAGQRAKSDVDGLIELLEDTPEEVEYFMDYNNVTQVVSLDELKIIRKEIIKNGKFLYATKWQYREAIEQAISIEELESMHFEFNNLTFLENASGEPISSDLRENIDCIECNETQEETTSTSL